MLVPPSRAETYGMVVTEALARGLPVLAADVGGVSEALGVDAGRRRPGLLVPAGDVGRSPRRCGAGSATPGCGSGCGRRRPSGAPELTGWPETAGRVARVLEAVAA